MEELVVSLPIPRKLPVVVFLIRNFSAALQWNIISSPSLLSMIVSPALDKYIWVPSVAPLPVVSFVNLILGFAEW